MLDVGQRLRELRKERNLTQDQLEKLSGISQSAISYIEQGGKNATVDTIERICMGLGISLHAFFDETQDPPRLISNFSDQNEYGEWLKHPRELRQLAMDLLDRARQAKQEKEK